MRTEIARVSAYMKIALLSIALLCVGCNSSNNSDVSATPQETVSRSIVLAPVEVGTGGCLSLQRLLRRLQNFPESTVGRIYSQDIDINAPANTPQGLKSLLGHASFKYQETRWSDIIDTQMDIHFFSARQTDCSSVTLYNQKLDPENYKITQASSDDLMLIQADNGTLIDLTLLSSDTIKIHLIYPVIDFSDACTTNPNPTDKRIMIDTTQILTWVDSESLFPSMVSVSSDMLKLISPSLNTPLPDLQINDDPMNNLPVSSLAEIRDSATAAILQNCTSP